MNLRTLIALVIATFMFSSCSRDLNHANTPIQFYCNIDLPWETETKGTQVESVVEPVVEPVVKPVVKPVVEPVVEPAVEPTTTICPAIEQTVYITKTGSCYHKISCSYLRYSCISIDLSDAKSRGYRPCSRCY